MSDFRDKFNKGVNLLNEKEKDLLFRIPGSVEAHLKRKKLAGENGDQKNDIIIVVFVTKNMLGRAKKESPEEFHGFRVELRTYIPPPPRLQRRKKHR